MDDREIKLRIAEIMGWSDLTPANSFTGKPAGKPPGAKEEQDVPDYPNDIAAAWEVAEKMKIALEPGQSEHRKRLWRAKVSVGIAWGQWVTDITAPRAICLAAIEYTNAQS